MNNVIVNFFLILLTCSSALYPSSNFPLREKIDVEPVEDELMAIERLIVLTEKQVMAQKEVKKLILTFRQDKELFLLGDQSKLHAHYMISSASQILALVQTYHLEHLFSSDFMQELALFNKIGKKYNE